MQFAYRLLVLAAAAALLPVPSLAQQQRSPHAKVKPNQIYGAGNSQDVLKYTQIKTAPTDLPSMTQVAPPGSRFAYGLKSIDNKGMTNLQLHYKTAYDSNSVLQTYTAQFKDPHSQWKAFPPAQNRVGARMGGNSCVVQYIPGGAEGAEVIINYQFHSGQ